MCSVAASGGCIGGEAAPLRMFLVLSLTAMLGVSSQVGPMKKMMRKQMLSMQPWIKGWMKEGRREGKTDYHSSLCIYLTWEGGGNVFVFRHTV